MSDKRWRIPAVALAALLALSACTSKSDEAAARKQAPIKLRLGLVYTTGGLGGDLAGPVLGAVKLATDAVAKDKVTIELTEVDYAGDRGRVAGAVANLASKVDAVVVGTDDPQIVPSLAGITGVPLIHAFVTTDAAVPESGNVFRFAPSNTLLANRMATFLTQHREYKRIAIVTDDTPFGREGGSALQQAFTGKGVTPVGTFTFAPGGDIHTPAAAVGQRNAQAAVVWVESPSEAARIVVEAHRLNFAYQIVLSGNLATATFAKSATAQVTPVAFRDGILSAGTWAGPWFRLERIVSFYREFKQQNSALAPVQAAAVYDAVLALARAARTHGTTGSSLAAGLESLKDFEGAGVPITFGRGKHEGIDDDDVAMLGFTKNQSAPGGDFAPDVDTGGGFFTVLTESLKLPPQYAYLTTVS